MKIEMKNIGIYANQTVIIPESGLIKIPGESGKGKSTIFEAVYEALTGKSDDIMAWDKSSCSVTLTIKDVAITRTRGPRTLTVSKEDKIYKDEEAQDFIDKFMGMNSFEFMVGSYIKQGMEGSLLSLPPAEQLKLIQQISTGKTDPEKVKKVIDLKVKECQNEEKNISTRISELTKLSEQTNSVLNRNESSVNDIVHKIAQIDIDLCKIKKEQDVAMDTEIAAVRRQISDLDRQISNPVFAKLDSFDNIVKELSEKNEKLSKNIEELSTELENVGNINEFDIRAAKESLAEALINKNFIDKVILFKQKIKKHTTPQDALNVIAEEIRDLNITLTALNDKKICVELEIKENSKLKASVACPHCNGPLAIINGNIQKHENISLDFIKEKEVKLAQDRALVLDKIEENKKLANKFNEYKSFAERFLDVPEHFFTNFSKFKNIQDECQFLQASIDKSDKDLLKIKSLRQKQEFYTSEISQNSKKIKDLFQEREEFNNSGAKTKDQLIKERDFCVNKDYLYQSQKRELAPFIAKIAEYEFLNKSLKTAQEDLNNSLVLRDDFNNKLSTAEQKLTENSNKISALKRAKEINDLASVTSIESTINQINLCASNYIEKFFPEDGTSVILNNLSVTGKGEERAKISVDIFHKGRQAKKLRSLSGGEKSRVFLAFQLALADIYKTPLLLVDEGLAGLGQDDKEMCLNYLKEEAMDKAVIIIEHGAPDHLFDHIVSV